MGVSGLHWIHVTFMIYSVASFILVGFGGSSEQCVPPDLQHGAQSTACGGDQPRVHAGEILLPVPAL